MKVVNLNAFVKSKNYVFEYYYLIMINDVISYN